MTDKLANEKRETRAFAVQGLKVEAREGGKGKCVRGYAAVFNALSENLGGFREIIKPGCFKRALAEKQDVRALVDHDSAKVLGRCQAGTLRMTEDDKGLCVEIDLPDTSYANDLAVSMQRGDVTQMSFGFRTVTDNWRMQDKQCIRDLMDVDLFDVSVVTYPAYPDTAAAVRSMEAFQKTQAPAAATHPLEDPEVARMVGEIGR